MADLFDVSVGGVGWHFTSHLIALAALFIACFAIAGYITFRDDSIPAKAVKDGEGFEDEDITAKSLTLSGDANLSGFQRLLLPSEKLSTESLTGALKPAGATGGTAASTLSVANLEMIQSLMNFPNGQPLSQFNNPNAVTSNGYFSHHFGVGTSTALTFTAGTGIAAALFTPLRQGFNIFTIGTVTTAAATNIVFPNSVAGQHIVLTGLTNITADASNTLTLTFPEDIDDNSRAITFGSTFGVPTVADKAAATNDTITITAGVTGDTKLQSCVVIATCGTTGGGYNVTVLSDPVTANLGAWTFAG